MTVTEVDLEVIKIIAKVLGIANITQNGGLNQNGALNRTKPLNFMGNKDLAVVKLSVKILERMQKTVAPTGAKGKNYLNNYRGQHPRGAAKELWVKTIVSPTTAKNQGRFMQPPGEDEEEG